MVNLLHPHERKALAAQIKADIDEFCRIEYNDGHRNHLGASLIGHKCDRYLWYVFRWIEASKFSGRMQRLFNRGHEQEERFVKWLRGIGCNVSEFEDPILGKQWRITGVGGHFGGSLDGRLYLPERYQVTDQLLLEMKTHKTGPGWQKLQANGVKQEEPKHFSQMSTYGRKYGIRYALYLSINKDDDDLHVEIVELDWQHGEDLERRAEHIITTQVPPPRINESPAFYLCKLCDRFEVCHRGAPYEKNCRSCENAVPVDGGNWWCMKAGAVIPDEVIPVGCDQWHPVGRA